MKKLAWILLMANTAPAFAWVAGNNLTITNVILWQDSAVNPVYFYTSGGFWCYVPASDTKLSALIFTLYATGKPAEVYCYDAAETVVGGVPDAHKLHRIMAQ